MSRTKIILISSIGAMVFIVVFGLASSKVIRGISEFINTNADPNRSFLIVLGMAITLLIIGFYMVYKLRRNKQNPLKFVWMLIVLTLVILFIGINLLFGGLMSLLLVQNSVYLC